jgi:NAD(P)-dependent dehydrogenase (short-subunit alcohol dehydrogenase family)
MESDMRLDGKRALITGGTTGIGYATAQRFLREGAEAIAITGQDAGRVTDAAAALGNRVTGLAADVRDPEAMDVLAAAVREALGGPLDVLFANAGIGAFAPLGDANAAFFDDQFDVNVKGVFLTVQKLVPQMAEGGSIILNASAVQAKGLAGGHVYLATKAAVRSLARSLAAELAPRGIRVNAVSPGMVPTPFQGKMGMPQDVLDGFASFVRGATPLARTGTPDEIAAAVAFLASADAAFVAGAELVVDGGWSAV